MDWYGGMDSNQQVHTPFQLACANGDEELVSKFLKAGIGVNVNEVDFAGCSPIQLAAAGGFVKVVKLLLQNGAKPEIQDTSHGNTCLHEGAWRGYSSLVKLLSNSTTINVQNYGGFTPLHLSCQAGHNQSTRELLLAGASPDLVNTYGDTALHTAVRYGHAGVARILLSARAQADIQNKNGDTALHISSAMGRKKLTKILLSSGCDPSLRNHQGEDPLDISLRKNFEDVAQVIRNPPKILTPLQRDEVRASTIKLSGNPAAAESKSKTKVKSHPSSAPASLPKSSPGQVSGHGRVRLSLAAVKSGHDGKESTVKTKRFGSSTKLGLGSRKGVNNASTGKSGSSPNSKDKGHGSNAKVQVEGECSRVAAGQQQSSSSLPEGEITDVPNWSPYGCHYHPNPGAFPPPNIDSLPKEPLTTGELYYLDLAGNIHKGPMGVSEGCYCNTLLSQSQNPNATSQSIPQDPPQNPPHHHHQPNDPNPPVALTSNKYEAQLKSLTNQLSKIHLDTQAQLSSLHSMLNERLKDSHDGEGYNETKLKDWVKQYRRFRKELSKNPKTLSQANELLSSASALLSTRLASPGPPDSETDSGI